MRAAKGWSIYLEVRTNPVAQSSTLRSTVMRQLRTSARSRSYLTRPYGGMPRRRTPSSTRSADSKLTSLFAPMSRLSPPPRRSPPRRDTRHEIRTQNASCAPAFYSILHSPRRSCRARQIHVRSSTSIPSRGEQVCHLHCKPGLSCPVVGSYARESRDGQWVCTWHDLPTLEEAKINMIWLDRSSGIL